MAAGEVPAIAAASASRMCRSIWACRRRFAAQGAWIVFGGRQGAQRAKALLADRKRRVQELGDLQPVGGWWFEAFFDVGEVCLATDPVRGVLERAARSERETGRGDSQRDQGDGHGFGGVGGHLDVPSFVVWGVEGGRRRVGGLTPLALSCPVSIYLYPV